MIVLISKNENVKYVLQKNNTILDLPIEKTPLSIIDYENKIILTAGDIYIIDVTLFSDPESILVDTIDRICRATNADIIIYAPGYDQNTRLLKSLSGLGYNKVVTERINQTKLEIEFTQTLKEEKVMPTIDDELEDIRNKAIDDIYEAVPSLKKLDEKFAFLESVYTDDTSEDSSNNPVNNKSNNDIVPNNDNINKAKEIPSDIDNTITEKEPLKERNINKNINSDPLKIAIIGSMPRIGTTTIAAQLVKYLNLKSEYSAAYIEHNDTGYINLIKDYYYCEYESKLSCIKYANIDFYQDPSKLAKIKAEGYSYLVYDYGTYEHRKVNSLMEKDIIIVVGGCEPDEIQNMTATMNELKFQKNIFYILSFVPPKDHKEIYNRMEQYSNKTYFFPPVFDKTVYVPEAGNIFNDILNSDYKIEPVKKMTRARRLFKK